MGIDRQGNVTGAACSESKDGHIAGPNGCCWHCGIRLADVESERSMTWQERAEIIRDQDPVEPDPEEEYWDA